MINTILFDIDGVILSEERCFDASALAVWEMLNSSKYLGLSPNSFTPEPDETNVRMIRDQVFAQNKVLSFIKHHGVNSNWDIVFLTFSYQILYLLKSLPENKKQALKRELKEQDVRSSITDFAKNLRKDIQPDFIGFINDFEGQVNTKQDMFDQLNKLSTEIIGQPLNWFTHKSPLWNLCRETYQEWYVGDEFIEESIGKKAYQPGKKGFLKEEITLASKDEIVSLYEHLNNMGFELGFATGRPAIETFEPLKDIGLLDVVSRNRIATSTDVIEAEAQFPEYAPLGKPAPFSYLYSFFGKDTDALEIIKKPLPLPESKKVLIVGDSIADGLAARSMGANFAAVLTGLTGEDARSEFEDFGADFILNHVREIKSLVNDLVTK